MNRSSLVPTLLLLSLLAAAPAHAGKTYCCTDERGRNLCGDVLPSECVGRAYRELGPRGNTLRSVEAALTPEQRAQREAEAARKKEEERLAKEEQRKNAALLNAYSSEKDIDFMRDRALADMAAAVKEAQGKREEAVKRKKKLEGELEFYKKKPVPANLQEQIKAADVDIKTQDLVLEKKAAEMDKVKAKFEEEKRHYLELKQNAKGAASSGKTAGAETTAPARPR